MVPSGPCEAGAPFPRQDGPPEASEGELAAADASCLGQIPNKFVPQTAVVPAWRTSRVRQSSAQLPNEGRLRLNYDTRLVRSFGWI